MLDATELTAYVESLKPAALESLRKMVEINSYTGNPEGVNV